MIAAGAFASERVLSCLAGTQQLQSRDVAPPHLDGLSIAVLPEALRDEIRESHEPLGRAARQTALLNLIFGNAFARLALAGAGHLAVRRMLRPMSLNREHLQGDGGRPRLIPASRLPRGTHDLSNLMST